MELKRLHPDTSLSKAGLAFWRRQPTELIVKSLAPGNRNSLKVKPNGIIDGWKHPDKDAGRTRIRG